MKIEIKYVLILDSISLIDICLDSGSVIAAGFTNLQSDFRLKTTLNPSMNGDDAMNVFSFTERPPVYFLLYLHIQVFSR